MNCKKNNQKSEKTKRKMTANEKYLHSIFLLIKRPENIAVTARNGSFNDTELRLLGEILAAKQQGKRLISTQLADLLGITRSAVSQIVNRLEERGVVQRVADEVDRKIAYIEATEEVLAQYEKESKKYAQFAAEVVKAYGADKFQTLCAMTDEFWSLLETKKQAVEEKNRR